MPKTAQPEPTEEHKAQQMAQAPEKNPTKLKVIAWYKHGPYDEGEPETCVMSDPTTGDETSDSCYSALVFESEASEALHAQEETIQQLKGDGEQLLADAKLGRILMRYIDRMNDATEDDPLPKIIKEMNTEVLAAIGTMKEATGKTPCSHTPKAR